MTSPTVSPNALTSVTERRWVIALGMFGLVTSWASFAYVFFVDGVSFLSFWEQALWTGDVAGLTYDLIACGGVLTALAWMRRGQLGFAKTATAIGLTWTLGVCVGFAALWFFSAVPLDGDERTRPES